MRLYRITGKDDETDDGWFEVLISAPNRDMAKTLCQEHLQTLNNECGFGTPVELEKCRLVSGMGVVFSNAERKTPKKELEPPKIQVFSWNRCESPTTAVPANNRYVLVAFDSGYIGYPWDFCVARYDPEYRPHHPWQTVGSDAVEPQPKWWAELPK